MPRRNADRRQCGAGGMHVPARLVVVCLCLCLAACGPTPASTAEQDSSALLEDVRAGVVSELELLKEPTEEQLAPFFDELDVEAQEELEAYGIDLYEMLSHVLSRFDYSVREVAVEDDAAQVLVEVRSLDLEAAAALAVERAQGEEGSAALADAYVNGSEQDLRRSAVTQLYEAMDQTDTVVTSDVRVTLLRDGDEWRIDQESLMRLVSGVLGGLTLADPSEGQRL